MAYIKNIGGMARGQGGASGMFQRPNSIGFRSPYAVGGMRGTTSRPPSYVDDEEVGAAHIVSPKGSVKKVGGVTQVRRGSARERFIAKNAKALIKGRSSNRPMGYM